MKAFSLLVILLIVPLANSQEHAPTIEVCRADSAVWKAPITNHDKESTAKLSFEELQVRAEEMHDCVLVDYGENDAANERMSVYAGTAAVYENEIAFRALNFIQRHGLTKQFVDEDAAGAR